jgi:GT2 family glycosyltransferase
MSEKKAAVVILNFNGKHFLEKFLPGVVQHSFPHDIYVADNASSDGSAEYLRKNFPQVKIVSNDANYGYAKGYNMALKQVEADYYILLNNDVEVTEGWIGKTLALMEYDPWIGACQPKLLDFNERQSFEYAGAAGGFIDRYCYPFCRGRMFTNLEKDTDQYPDAREAFWASGACLFVKSMAFWQVGGFDEHYFAHMEEIDLCWRFRNINYKIYVQPEAVVYHVGGGTLHKISSRKTYLNFRNNLSTIVKNHPPKKLLRKVLFRLILDGLAALKFLFEGQPRHFIAVISAHFTFYFWIPRLLRQRREYKRLPGFKFSTVGMYDGNIVWEYFLRNKTRFSQLTRGFFSE